MLDKYDEAIAYLTENSDRIGLAWSCPKAAKGGDLFLFLRNRDDNNCGCPTMVKNGFYMAFGDEKFTAEIRAMDIPVDSDEIKVQHLAAFAAIQRKADREFRAPNVSPELVTES